MVDDLPNQLVASAEDLWWQGQVSSGHVGRKDKILDLLVVENADLILA